MDAGKDKKRRIRPAHLILIVLLCVLAVFAWPRKADRLLKIGKENPRAYGLWYSAETLHADSFSLDEAQTTALMDYLDQYSITLAGLDLSDRFYLPACELYHRSYRLRISVDGTVSTGHWWSYCIRPWNEEHVDKLHTFLEELTGQELSGVWE